jgi:O-antigen/teichoic acid export membrane protein
MIISAAPFLVPQHEHDVDWAIATVVPLIFLTALLPEIPDAPDTPDGKGKSGREFQYTMRGFTILAGFAALVITFLQLAGEETTRGTISGMILLVVTIIFAICSMAWPIVIGMGQVGLTTVTVLLLAIVIPIAIIIAILALLPD